MAKSIKLNDDNYIDSSSVSHERTPLNDYLNGDVLYNNSIGEKGDVILSKSANDYQYIEIFYTQYQGYQNSTKVDLKITNKITLIASIWLLDQGSYNGIYFDTKQIVVDGKKINVISKGTLYYNNNFNKENQDNIKIHKVIGYK